MNDQNRHDPAAAAPAREPQPSREGDARQQQRGDQSQQERGGGQMPGGGRRNMRRRHGGGREGQPPQSQPSHSSETSINMDELRELFGLISAQGFTEFELEKEGFRVRLRRDLYAQPGAGSQAHAQPAPHVNSMNFAPPQQATQAAAGGATAAEAATKTAPPEEKPSERAAQEAELFTLTSPIVGTFYRSPSPEAEPFVKIGSHVEPETVVCIIEAMKLMNDILAEAGGTIEKIYVENGQPVEFGQPLFGIKKQ